MFQEFTQNFHQINNCQYTGYDVHSVSSLIERGQIPIRQKQIAANYIVIKKIFGFSAVHSRITNAELSLLKFFNLKPLEETDTVSMLKELEMLKSWSKEEDEIKNRQADNIFEIRVKELKLLKSNNSNASLNEFQDGYKALERYVEYIAG